MRLLTILAFAIMVARPSHAEWVTTSFLPIPYVGKSAEQVRFSNFSDFGGTWSSGYVQLNPDDDSIFKSGAIAPLTEGLRLASIDTKRLALAGFPSPVVQLVQLKTGEVYIPIVWEPWGGASGTGAYSCPFDTISFNNDNDAYPYKTLRNRWNSGGYSRSSVVDGLSSSIMHEVIHSIQENNPSPWACPKSWAAEATANGIANYLLHKRNQRALINYEWARNERRYNYPLYNLELEYESGSFIRYLIEATEANSVSMQAGGTSDLSLARDLIVKLGKEDVGRRIPTLKAIDKIIRPHSNDRPLAIILAEFFTEYASYGDRYNKNDDFWIKKGFSNCIEFTLLPGQVQTKEVFIPENAARCIKVEWGSFQEAKALQIYVEDAAVDTGSLHLGNAYTNYTHKGVVQRCYDVTSRIDNRIAEKTSKKCTLNRGATRIGAGGVGQGSVNGWTSDFNVEQDGYAYLIIANAAKDISTTEEVTINLTIGTLLATKKDGTALAPRKETQNPVQGGKTLMDSRVHAMTAGRGRAFFDGRSVFGDGVGLGFLEGVPGAGEINSSATVVRGKDYWVLLSKDKSGFPDGGMILKNPDQAAGEGAIITLGVQGMGQMPSCGYQIPAQLTIKEDTKERIVFEVSGDLFRFSRQMMMSAGGGDFCNILKTAHVEHQSIEVVLPWSDFYKASTTTRINPPMQDLYEREFGSGPSFGGIETAKSLVLGDETSPDEGDTDDTGEDGEGTGEDGGSDDAGENGESSNSSSAADGLQCTCHCPDIVYPPTGRCFETCESQLNFCPAPTSAQAMQADSDLYSSLLEQNTLSEDVSSMLRQDFDAMSAETRSQILRELLSE